MNVESSTTLPASRRAGAIPTAPADLFLPVNNVKKSETICSAPYAQGANQIERKYILHPQFNETIASDSAPPDVCCWHCLDTFTTKMVRLPMEFNELTGKPSGLGFFCSAPCAKRWAIEHPNFNTPHQMMLLAQCCGFTKPVKPALPQVRLKKMGGDLDTATFRRLSQEGLDVVVNTPPFITWAMVFEERRKNVSESTSSSESVVHSSTTFPGIYGGTREEEKSKIRGLRAPAEAQVNEHLIDTEIYQPMPPMYDQFLEMKKAEQGAAGTNGTTNTVPSTKAKGSTMKSTPAAKKQKTKPTEPPMNQPKGTLTTSSHVQIEAPKKVNTDSKRGSLQAFMKKRKIEHGNP